MEETDAAPVDVFRRGIRDELSDVYDRHGDRLYTFALQRLCDPAEAADVVDRTFAQASLRSVGLPIDTAIGPWLFAIGREVLADHVRQRERLVALGSHAGPAATPPVDLTLEPGTDGHRLAHALGQLRDVDRDLFELHLWDGSTPRSSRRCSVCSPITWR